MSCLPLIPEYVVVKIIEIAFQNRWTRFDWRLSLATLSWRYFNHLSKSVDTFNLFDRTVVSHVTSPYCLMREPRTIYTSLSNLNRLLRDPLSAGFLTTPSPFTTNVEQLVIVENSLFSMVSIIDISNFVAQLPNLVRFHLESNFNTITPNTFSILESTDAKIVDFQYLAPMPADSTALVSLIRKRAPSLQRLEYGHRSLMISYENERIIYNEIISQHQSFTQLRSLTLQCGVSDTLNFFTLLLALQQLESLALMCTYKAEAVARKQLASFLNHHDALRALKVTFLFDSQLTAAVNSRQRLRSIVMSPNVKLTQKYADLCFTSLDCLKLSSKLLAQTIELNLSGINNIRTLHIDLNQEEAISLNEGSLATFIETNNTCRLLKTQYTERIVGAFANNTSIDTVVFKSLEQNNPFFAPTFQQALSKNSTVRNIFIYDYSQPATNKHILRELFNRVEQETQSVSNQFILLNIRQYIDESSMMTSEMSCTVVEYTKIS
ncbi:hypothetical protein PPL_00327 [Heterostelium album PN500]|uniref:F-box domain-containing protein n=1 Tax=Heterostelium pallidum (strain ATCC 26659 / Pp 5 / PN500) TaxID=670386 RepID=D3AW58_HETP5|nr:hypothetical protein PPL_00327 [Heterostelium album PN500]EFA86531.1 hypothetical protein PPL_00327 [Heterostelium album PN500]|eukprot:XP_020438636.1 hypothetical protein PPL_00327 [Heterostelium album PN500]